MSQVYISPYAPKYKVAPHIRGWPIKALVPWMVSAGAFSGVAGMTAIYFLEGVPRVQRDILQKLPVIGEYWRNRGKPASDNPF
ncbi:hypothetical protein RUND412_000924 [Rhizina undulata]